MHESRDHIRLKILDEAELGVSLFSLLDPVSVSEKGRKWELHGATDRDQTRDVLVELLRDGLVELFALTADRDARLDTETALTAIQDDVNWEWPGKAGRAVIYDVALTDAGDAAYYVVRDRVAAARNTR